MGWFKHRTVTTKLLIGFTSVTLVLAGVALYALHGMGRTQNHFDDVYENNLVPMRQLATARAAMLRIRAHALEHVIAKDAARERDLEARIKELDEVVAREMKAFAQNRLEDEEKRGLAAFQKAWPQYQQGRDGTVLRLSAAGKKGEAVAAAAGEVRQAFQEALDTLGVLFDANVKLAGQAAKDARDDYVATRLVTVAILLGGVALSVLLGFLIARTVARPLAGAVAVLEGVARGDLTRRLRIDTRDEVGRLASALDQAVEGMAAALREVRGAADHATVASQQLAAAAEQLSSGAQEQASSLEETAASLEEITGTVKQNADNAKQANQLAMSSRATAEKGGRVVADAVDAMRAINAASKKIADIIATIDDIAFQTNLLALNAAVEAARAGEQGRGFAVVAAEVRALAQRSATAAKEIKDLIQDSVRKVEAGSTLVNQSGQSLDDIVAAVKRVTDIIAEIAAASQEQSTGIDQVNRAVTQMDQVVQANAAQTEELSSTAQTLATQARELQALVGRFRLADDGPVARPASTPAASPGAGSGAPISEPAVPRARGGAQSGARGVAGVPRAMSARLATVAAPKGNGSTHAGDDGFEEF
jgi:methyl-accepting chemotaxis protein